MIKTSTRRLLLRIKNPARLCSAATRGGILDPSHLSIVADEKSLLTDIYKTLTVMGADQDELDLVLDSRSRIEDFFTMVVVGEFNSGKSTLINSLLGQKLLEEGPLPTTSKICIVRPSPFSNADSKSASSSSPSSEMQWRRADNFVLDDVEELFVPAHPRQPQDSSPSSPIEDPLTWMRSIAVVDTPGTNALIKRHEQLTAQIVPRADLVLFVTSAERPMSESESQFLAQIRDWSKKVVVVVNKIDILPVQEDDGNSNQQPSSSSSGGSSGGNRKRVLDYVSQNVAAILGTPGLHTVPVFAVSGRLALRARMAAGPGGDVLAGQVRFSSFLFFSSFLLCLFGF
jgi:ribosome biogenesis GTPase A